LFAAVAVGRVSPLLMDVLAFPIRPAGLFIIVPGILWLNNWDDVLTSVASVFLLASVLGHNV